jgi:thioredoxin 1
LWRLKLLRIHPITANTANRLFPGSGLSAGNAGTETFERFPKTVTGKYTPGLWSLLLTGGKKTVSENILHVSDASFEEDVLKSDKTVLVDYWAEWCGPCKMIAPILDEISQDYADKVKIAKLNIDENPETPPKYGIRGIPTLMLFKNGSVQATKVGALSKSQLTAFIDSNL